MPGAAGIWRFCTVSDTTGTASVKLVTLVARVVALHRLVPSTNPVLFAVVVVHTGPTVPVSVNVYVSPGAIVPVLFHPYHVPLPICAGPSGVNPAGWSCATPVTTAA